MTERLKCMQPPPAGLPQEESEDLIRFRQQWTDEVRKQKAKQTQFTEEIPKEEPVSSPGPSRTAHNDELAKAISTIAVKHGTEIGNVITGLLASVIANFPHPLSFEPEIENEGVPINMLPDELLVHIFRSLDHTSIERVGMVNRKARVITLDPAIWRDFFEIIYKPPQVIDGDSVVSLLDTYALDYRRIYIEHPRIRLDGVYISVCHYIRPGLGENIWVNVNHLITYRRYLRFFPTGEVLSLLANEEIEPPQIIPMLKPTLRMKGLFIGTWQLLDNIIQVTDLADASGKYPYPPILSPPIAANPAAPRTTPRYTFQMTLELRSRPLGRWNRLDFVCYESVDLENGDVVPLVLKHEKPFWFSKVRSWSI